MTVVRNQQGIALVITLLVVALLAITVIEFTYTVQINRHMARNALSGLQASLLARSGINLGEAFLLRDEDPVADAFTEDWCPDPSPDGYSCRIDDANSEIVLPPNLRLRVQIVDEAGKLNINVVRFRGPDEWRRWLNTVGGDPKNRPQPLESWRLALERLLDSHGADPQIADRLLEYWDAVFQARYPQMAGNPVQGTPSPNPTASSTPAQLTQLEFASLDDASVIPGMTPAVIRRLRPLLTALPSSQQRINANTAPPEVLRAIVDDDETVSTIVSTRGEAPLTQANLGSMLSPLNRGGTASRNYAGAMLGVTSSFFLVHASGVVNPNPVTGRGGIGRSATMLVRRTRRNPAQSQTGSVVPWTLTQLDWQKEGGAALFQAPTEERAEVEELAGLPRIE